MEPLMRITCISMRKSNSEYQRPIARLIGNESYNWGGKVLGLNFDDHVGDWSVLQFFILLPYQTYEIQGAHHDPFLQRNTSDHVVFAARSRRGF